MFSSQLELFVPSSTGFDTSILPICKDSLGWMFNKLDMNYDLLLDHSEINAIYLDKYEPCIKPLFNSCDSFKDGKLSNNEWCYCFQKPGGNWPNSTTDKMDYNSVCYIFLPIKLRENEFMMLCMVFITICPQYSWCGI